MGVRLAALVSCTIPAALTAQDYTIAFNSFAPANTEIMLADGDGGDPRPLLPHPALDYNASFSSDGAWVVFTSERDGSADIYRARIDGSSVERLVDHAAFDDQAALSPDGKSLAFVSARSGQADVWVIELATQRSRNLTDAPSGEFRPAWSPDGQWLALVSDRAPARTTCVGSGATTGPGPFVTPHTRACMSYAPMVRSCAVSAMRPR